MVTKGREVRHRTFSSRETRTSEPHQAMLTDVVGRKLGEHSVRQLREKRVGIVYRLGGSLETVGCHDVCF